MKKSRKTAIIVVSVILAIILVELFSYKIALIQINKPTKGQGYKTLSNIGEKITIKTNQTSETKSYLNINYPVLEEGFKFSKGESTIRYNAYNFYSQEEGTPLVAGFKIGTAYNYYDKIIQNADGKVVKVTKELLNKYNINNNFEVIEYLKDHYDDMISIFTKSDDIKFLSLMKTYANTLIPSGTIRYIDGDLEGFMITSDDGINTDVNLKYNDELYYLSFTNKKEEEQYFTQERIIEFLQNITFKK